MDTQQALFPRSYALQYPTIVRAEGIRLWDESGKEYIDSTSGAISVVSIGHGRREVADAMHAQILRMDYVHDQEFHNEPSQELARRVVAFAGGSFSKAVFFTGGSEAIESALKLAHNYHVLRGHPAKNFVLARKRSFHGALILSLAAGDVSKRKSIYQGYMPAVTAKISAPDPYRTPAGLDPEEAAIVWARELEQSILELGPENVSAFIAEPLGGAAAPALVPPAGYFEEIRRICDRYDVLWVSDEIVTGFGRTGRNFGFQHWAAQPDILVVAKGLSGGYVPLSGVVISSKVDGPFLETKEPYVHGLTYQNHPVSAAAGLAVLGVIEREALVENAAIQGAHLGERLRALADELPFIGHVRGRGLLWGMELVRNRATKEPFDRSLGVSAQVFETGLRHGIVLYQGGWNALTSDELLVSPPLVVTRSDVDEIADRVAETLREVQAEVLGTAIKPQPVAADQLPIPGAPDLAS